MTKKPDRYAGLASGAMACDAHPEMYPPTWLPGEREVVGNVLRAGAQYGYGNLIDELLREWGRVQGDPLFHLKRASAMGAVADELLAEIARRKEAPHAR